MTADHLLILIYALGPLWPALFILFSVVVLTAQRYPTAAVLIAGAAYAAWRIL